MNKPVWKYGVIDDQNVNWTTEWLKITTEHGIYHLQVFSNFLQ